MCRGVQRVQRAGCGWQSLSDDWFLFGMYVCVYVRVCLEDSPYTAWLTFWKKSVCWGVGGGKDKKSYSSPSPSPPSFLPSPFFLSLLHFTSIHTPIPLFLPPYLRHSAHPALYHHMPQRKYALCSPAPELTQLTPPATGRQDPPLPPPPLKRR